MDEILDKSKEYDDWNEKKKLIEQDRRFKGIYFRQGDIWWCHLGKNIGTESYGKGINFRRPVLVFKKLSSESFIAIPLSMQEKHGTWFVEIVLNNEKRWALLHQIKMAHSKRITIKLGELSESDLLKVKEKLAALLEFSCENRHPAEAEIEGETPKT